jgi:hypothetical protein
VEFAVKTRITARTYIFSVHSAIFMAVNRWHLVGGRWNFIQKCGKDSLNECSLIHTAKWGYFSEIAGTVW